MKKKIITCSLLLGFAVASLPAFYGGNSTIAKADSTIVKVNKMSNQLSQWYGTGALIEMGNFSSGGYTTIYDSANGLNDKVHLYNSYLEEQPCKFLTVGTCLLMNQNSAGELNYYGYVLQFDEGFTFECDGKSYSFGETQSYLCKIPNGVGGRYWDIGYTPSLSTNESSFTVEEGKSHQIDLTVGTTDASPIISYKSSDTSVAQVDANGVVTGVTAGTTTITAYCVTQTITYTVTVEQGVVPQSGIVCETKTLETYKGYSVDWSALEVYSMYGTEKGGRINVTSDMISGAYDINTVGEYTLTVTSNGFKDTFVLKVSALPQATIGTTSGYDFGNNSMWGTPFYFTSSAESNGTYVNIKGEAFDNVMSHIRFNGGDLAVDGIKNSGGNRYEFWFNSSVSLKAGDVIELLAGLPIYRFTGNIDASNHEADFSTGKFIPIAELGTTYRYVYTGSTWEVFVGSPTSITLDCKSRISVGEQVQINYTLGPSGTYGTPSFSSMDESIATVDGLGRVVGVKEGNTKIVATIGDVKGEIAITVAPEKTVTGIKLLGMPNYYSLPVGTDVSTFKPVIASAQLEFEDGTVGPVTELSEGAVSVGTFSTEATGEFDVPVTVCVNGNNYEATIPVHVYEYYDQKVSEVGIVDWFIYSVFFQLPNTSSNVANLTGGADQIPGLYDGISYKRADGTPVKLSVIYQLGTNIAIFPEFLFDASGNGALDNTNYNDYYLAGDTVTIKANTPVYLWTGNIVETSSDNHALEAGTGEVIVEGYIKEELTYRYDGNVWGIYIEYTDMNIASDTIDLKINESKSAGATRVPGNATSGTFTYTSSDPSIATVNANGVIKGISEGTATITVKLSDGGKNEKVGTITVNVSDGIKTVKFPEDLKIKKGTDISKYDWSKVEVKAVYYSGKEEVVSPTNIQVAGFDPDTLGKQNVVITMKIDGATYSAKVVVEVVASSGCGGSIVATSGLLSIIALSGIVLTSFRRKEEK